MDTTWSIVGALVLFACGMLAKDRLIKRNEVARKVESAKTTEQRGVLDAREKYVRRIRNARKATKESVGNRPVTADPIADLRERIARQ